MLSEIEQVLPSEIEKRSFEIITEELKEMGKILCPETELIVKRCIHTSADFEYADSLVFTEGVVEKAKDAIRRGVPFFFAISATSSSDIKQSTSLPYSARRFLLIPAFPICVSVIIGTTRAVASMDKAAALGREAIFAVGNAPTALVRLYELIKEGKINPELIIAVPVGFVNVVQSKELILSLEDTPSIVARGRKGGSNIAACICNALLYQM